jgi:hypothetical protein
MGDPGRPRGHALLFFRNADDPDAAWATYLVVAPIALDLTKYIPAAFAPQIPTPGPPLGSMAYPLPPIPEKVEGGLAALERLAEVRGDDLLDGGTVRVTDPWQVMHPVAEIGREYAERYAEYVATASAASEPAPSLPAVDVDELLLQVMPDREKVGRLARLAGTLRYALEGGDERLVRETVARMESIGRYLGEKYRSRELIAAARSAAPRAAQLAQLYVERCYRLADEDYAALADLDQRIARLQSESADQT